MADRKQLPEHIQQAVDLISAILRRIRNTRLDNEQNRCLYMKKAKGATV